VYGHTVLTLKAELPENHVGEVQSTAVMVGYYGDPLKGALPTA